MRVRPSLPITSARRSAIVVLPELLPPATPIRYGRDTGTQNTSPTRIALMSAGVLVNDLDRRPGCAGDQRTAPGDVGVRAQLLDARRTEAGRHPRAVPVFTRRVLCRTQRAARAAGGDGARSTRRAPAPTAAPPPAP